MWKYLGLRDATRISKDNLADEELKKLARRLTKLMEVDDISIVCRVDPLDKDHPTPPVTFFLLAFSFEFLHCSCLPFIF
jgi:hypothetical protein